MPLLKFQLNEHLYIRDPQETEYGQRLLKESINLIHYIGFESFTFKKLATKINSVEASVYRYFENKHKLLLFLTNWYYEFVFYSISMYDMMYLNAEEYLKIAVKNLIESKLKSNHPNALDIRKLCKLVIEQSTKAYHVHDVDMENKLGLFSGYKKLSGKFEEILKEINPEFRYPKSLASTIIDLTYQQLFFAEHLPSLSNIKKEQSTEELTKMVVFFTKKILA